MNQFILHTKGITITPTFCITIFGWPLLTMRNVYWEDDKANIIVQSSKNQYKLNGAIVMTVIIADPT